MNLHPKRGARKKEVAVLGRWVSDLEVGDVFPTVEYDVTPFMARDYAHSVESDWERFHGPVGGAAHVAPPTLAHIDKLRLLAAASPEGAGPVPRMQLEYAVRHFSAIPVGSRLSLTGHVEQREARRGREHVVITFDVRDALTGELRTRCRDTSILNFVPEETR
jgi:hypothetical protein